MDRGSIDYDLGLMRVMFYSNLFLIALTTSIYVVEKNVITDCLDRVMQFQGGHVYIVCFLGVDQGRASLGTWWVEGGGSSKEIIGIYKAQRRRNNAFKTKQDIYIVL